MQQNIYVVDATCGKETESLQVNAGSDAVAVRRFRDYLRQLGIDANKWIITRVTLTILED